MGIPTNRYSKIMNKHPREICLLRSFPCAWGKCAFCDYIEDNGKDGVLMAQLNRQVLGQVTGEFGVLEVINSGSCFELPKETLEDIDKVIQTKDLKQLFFESHWMYRGQVADFRRRMGAPVVFKIGVETFDYDFRQKVLNKHADFKEPGEVAEYFDSPCLMVGIKGQTREMKALPEKKAELKRLYGREPGRFTLLVKEEYLSSARDYQAMEQLVREAAPAWMEAKLVPLRPCIQLGDYTYLGINSRLGQYRPLKLDGLSAIPFTVIGGSGQEGGDGI